MRERWIHAEDEVEQLGGTKINMPRPEQVIDGTCGGSRSLAPGARFDLAAKTKAGSRGMVQRDFVLRMGAVRQSERRNSQRSRRMLDECVD